MGNAEHAYLERWMDRTTLNFESTSIGVYSLEEGRILKERCWIY